MSTEQVQLMIIFISSLIVLTYANGYINQYNKTDDITMGAKGCMAIAIGTVGFAMSLIYLLISTPVW